MRIAKMLKAAQTLLTANSIPNARLDAILILDFVTGLGRTKILAEPDLIVNEQETSVFFSLINKRASQMPLQYITQKAEFMSLNFYVDENVLIPREDTEILVELAINLIKQKDITSVLELCTGSGCISVSLAHYCPNVSITAVDICPKALKVAEKNANINNVHNKINFIRADVLSENFPSYPLIIANPPYIKKDTIADLPPSVRDFEPRIALDGKEDGLIFYRAIAKSYKNHVLVEIGYDQADEVSCIFQNNGFTDIKVYKDLSGLDRVVYAYKA